MRPPHSTRAPAIRARRAASSAVADLMTMSTDDLAWARPYVDEAHASVARGDVSTGEDVLARLRSRIAQLKSA